MEINSRIIATVAAVTIVGTVLAQFVFSDARRSAPPAQKPMLEAVPSVTVTGDAEVKSTPDVATISIGVQAGASTAKAAREKVNVQFNAVLAAVSKFVDAKTDVQTTNISVYPDYNDKGRVIGYEASNMVRIEVKNLDNVGNVIDAATVAGANRINSIDFGLRDSDQAYEEALQKAVAKARRKAQVLASASGRVLNQAIQIQEGPGTMPMPRMQMRAKAADGFAAEASTAINPGQITTSAQVTVVFDFK
ncbi:MAG: SIMPL domain-containing protein [Fimbriimonadaceae bacterium]|nr:SIMPL domain-containing protein [Fimbriimonadaceae bacterium]